MTTSGELPATGEREQADEAWLFRCVMHEMTEYALRLGLEEQVMTALFGFRLRAEQGRGKPQPGRTAVTPASVPT
jgi:hypothetical protein